MGNLTAKTNADANADANAITKAKAKPCSYNNCPIQYDRATAIVTLVGSQTRYKLRQEDDKELDERYNEAFEQMLRKFDNNRSTAITVTTETNAVTVTIHQLFNLSHVLEWIGCIIINDKNITIEYTRLIDSYMYMVVRRGDEIVN